VEDIARANLLALNSSGGDYEYLNIGSGNFITIGELGNTICALTEPIFLQSTNCFRVGDTRHLHTNL